MTTDKDRDTMNLTDEFIFLRKFAKTEELDPLTMKQTRALWTAFCLHYNLECDTAAYDFCLLHLWEVVDHDPKTAPWQYQSFDLFDQYMGELLS